MKSSFASMVALMLLAGWAWGQSPASGPRVTDSLRGFSIAGPAGAEVLRETNMSELVSFNVRDPNSGAIALWMKVLQVKAKEIETQGATKAEPQTAEELQAYAIDLARQLRHDQSFQVELDKLAVINVAGKPAFDLRGQVGEDTKVYTRQVWVRTEPETFLILLTSAPLARAEQVIQSSQASLNSMRLFDPQVARQQREADLQRGEQLLKNLNPDRISERLARDDYWMAILKDGQFIGFAHYTERTASERNAAGVQVVLEMALTGQKDARTLIRQVMFSSYDRRMESWQADSVSIDAEGARSDQRQKGFKQAELLLISSSAGGETYQTSDQKKVPEQNYLPQALGMMLPRLIDLTAGASYGFAIYSPGNKEIDMRTITVAGPGELVLGGQTFQAIRLTDQMAVDAPLVELFVDSAGLPLKLVSDDGTVLQRTTGQAIQSRFSRELVEVRQLGQ